MSEMLVEEQAMTTPEELTAGSASCLERLRQICETPSLVEEYGDFGEDEQVPDEPADSSFEDEAAAPREEAESPEEQEDAACAEAAEGENWPYGDCLVPEEGLPSSREITTKELGRRGENAAANYLVRKGYRILERNWTCRFGEADIIAVDEEGTVVFVEVKTRRTSDCGLPEESITKEKQRRYEKIALTYLMEADWDDDVDFRFDAIGIYVTGDYRAMLKHHLGCFNGF